MHPNAFLKTFWRREYRPEIFVAMSFADAYQQRFDNIIAPAIRGIDVRGTPLTPKRVDLSKSGDSILTDIVDGIAHCVMVLADVSIVGHDSKTSTPYRNANVLYEVGIALACRHSSEVLLIRDDKERFLFDVSTIPHKHIDFANVDGAKRELTEELNSRLREREVLRDARVQTAIATLTRTERNILSAFAKYEPDTTFHLTKTRLYSEPATARLLDKQLMRVVAVTSDNEVVFAWTEVGYTLAQRLDELVPVINRDGAGPAPTGPDHSTPDTPPPASNAG